MDDRRFPDDLPLRSAEPAPDGPAWDLPEERPQGRAFEFDPMEKAGGPAPPPAGPEPGKSLFLRIALPVAALIALVSFSRELWWPGEPEAPDTAPKWAAAPHVPPPAEPAAPPVIIAAAPPARPAPEAAPEVEEEEKAAADRPVLARRALPPAPWETGSQPEGLLRPGPGVEQPIPLDLPQYRYPPAARGTGLQVDVRLALLVDERGRVIDAVVREGGPEDLGFDQEALRVARQIPFQPATRYDVPGKMWTEMILELTE